MGIFGGGGTNTGAGPTSDPTGGSDLSGGFNPDPQAFDPNSPMGGGLSGGLDPSSQDFAPPGSPLGNALFSSLGMGQPPTPPSVNPPDVAGAQSGRGLSGSPQPANQATSNLNQGSSTLADIDRLLQNPMIAAGPQGPSWFQSAVNQNQPQGRGFYAQNLEGISEQPSGQPNSATTEYSLEHPERPLPIPQPRPPGAPQFPMPQPRPPEAPSRDQAPPAPPAPTPQPRPARPDQDLPATPPTTPPATPEIAGGTSDTRTPTPGGQGGQPPVGGQQQFRNPIQALLQGGPMAFLQSLLGLTRQVGPNYYQSRPLAFAPEARQPPQQPPQQETTPASRGFHIPSIDEGPLRPYMQGSPGQTDAASFIQQRGGHTSGTNAPAIQPEFASRVQRAAQAYEAETHQTAIFGETGRSKEQQAIYYNEMLHGGGGLAAPPGRSRHQLGEAVDIPRGQFQDWMRRNGGKYGVSHLNDPRDPNHFFLDRSFSGQQPSSASQQSPSSYAKSVIEFESGENPRERTGSNRGLVQFGRNEERMYMRDIPPGQRQQRWAQELGLQREKEDHTNILRRSLGREPSPAELYLTHQQGRAGGPALLKADSDTPAWQAIRQFYRSDAIAQRAIHGNIPSDNPLRRVPVQQITAGQFRNMWLDRFNRGYAQDAQPGQQIASGAPPRTPLAEQPHHPFPRIDPQYQPPYRGSGVSQFSWGERDAVNENYPWARLPNTDVSGRLPTTFEERFRGQ